MDYKYCPTCKNPLNKSEEHFQCPSCGLKIYINSKPCAGILPIKDGRVLLSRRAIEPFKGEYDIIGGFLMPGEHPKDGAIREAKEETGLNVKAEKLLGIYMDKYGEGGDYTLNLHYVGKITDGEIKARKDVSSLHWIPIEDAPESEGFKNTKEAIKDLKKWYSKSR